MTDHGPELPASIIVPTYNRRSRLERLLRRLDRSTTGQADFEVIVTVDGATDGTQEMLAALQTTYPLHILLQANRGPAAARNQAIAVARGDVLIFLDDDVVPVTGAIERHLRHHRRNPNLVVTGPMVEPPGLRLAPWLRWEALKLQKQYDAMVQGLWAPTPRQFYTANASVRREHALRAGGFDERFTRAEDVEFAYRLADRGVSFHFDPAAAVLHEPDRSFSSWMRVPYEYGQYDVLMEQRGRRHLHLAVSEDRTRHLLNRLLPRWCVGRRWQHVVLSALAVGIRHQGPGAAERVQLALCSAVWNVRYWQGVADTTGRGAALWRDFAGGISLRPAGIETNSARIGMS